MKFLMPLASFGLFLALVGFMLFSATVTLIGGSRWVAFSLGTGTLVIGTIAVFCIKEFGKYLSWFMVACAVALWLVCAYFFFIDYATLRQYPALVAFSGIGLYVFGGAAFTATQYTLERKIAD